MHEVVHLQASIREGGWIINVRQLYGGTRMDIASAGGEKAIVWSRSTCVGQSHGEKIPNPTGVEFTKMHDAKQGLNLP